MWFPALPDTFTTLESPPRVTESITKSPSIVSFHLSSCPDKIKENSIVNIKSVFFIQLK